MEVPEAGHFVQEFGDEVAKAALAHFKTLIGKGVQNENSKSCISPEP
ncbi:hypothetical protein JCM19233_418 [Vibrio astriarenae]|nr:hypothetical protein JCM19233_418 [Vibrio sp. C7]